MSHTDPRVKEAIIEFNSLLEVLACNFVFLAVEVVSSNGKPADGMGGIVFD